MKIAVYSIALNEAAHVERWLASCDDADVIYIADTGSTDGTQSVNRDHGMMVRALNNFSGDFCVTDIHISPWRFDHARNAALALLPADIDLCITLDLDEVLAPGWRAALESVWQPGVTRVRYDYIWNWTADGKPLTQFRADRIHARNGYSWKHPVHETIYPSVGTVEKFAESTLAIHHHADNSKPRSYLPLLEIAVAEEPQNSRMAFYYARELMYKKQWAAMIPVLQNFLRMPTAVWDQERAAAYRYMAQAQSYLGDSWAAADYAVKACEMFPHIRECWCDLARIYMVAKRWQDGIDAARRAIACDRSTSYVADTDAVYSPFDYGSVCAYYAGDKTLAREWYARALELAPHDERIRKNGEWLK